MMGCRGLRSPRLHLLISYILKHPAGCGATFRYSFRTPPSSSRSLAAILGIPELHSVLRHSKILEWARTPRPAIQPWRGQLHIASPP